MINFTQQISLWKMNTKQRQAANNWQKLTATSAKILIALDRRSWTQTSRRAEWVLFFGPIWVNNNHQRLTLINKWKEQQ